MLFHYKKKTKSQRGLNRLNKNSFNYNRISCKKKLRHKLNHKFPYMLKDKLQIQYKLLNKLYHTTKWHTNKWLKHMHKSNDKKLLFINYNCSLKKMIEKKRSRKSSSKKKSRECNLNKSSSLFNECINRKSWPEDKNKNWLQWRKWMTIIQQGWNSRMNKVEVMTK